MAGEQEIQIDLRISRPLARRPAVPRRRPRCHDSATGWTICNLNVNAQPEVYYDELNDNEEEEGEDGVKEWQLTLREHDELISGNSVRQPLHKTENSSDTTPYSLTPSDSTVPVRSSALLRKTPHRKSHRGREAKSRNNPAEDAQIKEKAQASAAFNLHTKLYSLSEHATQYNRVYGKAMPHLLMDKTKFYIETEAGGVGPIDILFTSFCLFMKMTKVKYLPTDGGEKVFCRLGKRKAAEVLPSLRPGHHFVNRLPLDVCLKDKQAMAHLLRENVMRQYAVVKSHTCHYVGKRMGTQMVCRHQFENHSFQKCNVEGCRESILKTAKILKIYDVYDGEACPCFSTHLFVPETGVFSSSMQQNVFIDEMERIAPKAQWIVKPSYMRSGHGIRVLSSAEYLRKFLKVNAESRFMWGQDYVAQRYIDNPMLTDVHHKFDVRMFLLIVVCRFFRVLGFFHPGFVRKVPQPYRKMENGELFELRHHLANTRIWQEFADHDQQEAAEESRDDDDADGDVDGEQAQANRDCEDDPVPRLGFFESDFDNDECEDYNFAVQHGCLSNQDDLPLMIGNTDVPLKTRLYRRKEDDESKKDIFLIAIHTMVNRICDVLFDKIKEQTNCYQLFSLDICIDENNKPWLLEINPTILTEKVNWQSRTIKEVISAVYLESLALASESMRKSLSFLAIRTWDKTGLKQNDLVFRQNFLWMYSSPAKRCKMFELKEIKLSVEEMYRSTCKEAVEPVDYYPWLNRTLGTRSARQHARATVQSSCEYNFPTPVARVPVMPKDIQHSLRFKDQRLGRIRRQIVVRKLEKKARARRKHNEKRRYRIFTEKRNKKQEKLKARVNFDA